MIGIQHSFQSDFLPTAKAFHDRGYQLFATEATAEYLKQHNISAETVGWQVAQNEGAQEYPTATQLIQNKEVDLVINLPNHNTKYVQDNYLIRRSAIDSGVPLLTNFQVCFVTYYS